MSKDRTINWKIAVVVLVILSALIAFAGGYVYTEYRNLKTTKLEIEAENRRLKSDIEDKETSISVYKDSLNILNSSLNNFYAQTEDLVKTLDSVQTEYEDLLIEVENRNFEEQVELFNKQTGIGTPATLVEHSSDTIVMTPVPRITSANISMIKGQLLEEKSLMQDSVIYYQSEQIRVLTSINTTQSLVIEDQREIIETQDRRLKNQEELIEELDSYYAIRRWRSAAIGTGVGLIIGLIL